MPLCLPVCQGKSVNRSRVLCYETSAVIFVSFLVLIGFLWYPPEIGSSNALHLMLTNAN